MTRLRLLSKRDAHAHGSSKLHPLSSTHKVVMALHFSTEKPDDQFYTDFGNLNKFEDEVKFLKAYFSNFFHPLSPTFQPFSKLSSILFNFLVSPEQVEYTNSLH